MEQEQAPWPTTCGRGVFPATQLSGVSQCLSRPLNGDGEPRWTEVWSHIQLGKIFDVTGQRERATNEYRQALQPTTLRRALWMKRGGITETLRNCEPVSGN